MDNTENILQEEGLPEGVVSYAFSSPSSSREEDLPEGVVSYAFNAPSILQPTTSLPDYAASDRGTNYAINYHNLEEDGAFQDVERYMQWRNGMNTGDFSREEIVDSFVKHMRKFSFGQSVVTAGELAKLSVANQSERDVAGVAYSLFDNMAGAFSDEYTLGERGGAVLDYARALIVDPINIVSLGVGKLVSGGATRAAATVAKEAVKRAILKELGQAAISGSASKAAQATAQQIERRIIGRIIKGEAVEGVAKGAFEASMKNVLGRDILATVAFDTTAAVGIDYLYQSSRIYTGIQSDYDVLQGAITGVSGVAMGGAAYGLHLLSKGVRKGSKNVLPLYIKSLDDAKVAEAAAIKAMREGRFSSNAKALENLDTEAFTTLVKESIDRAKVWADKVLRGDTSIRGTAAEPRDDVFLKAFLLGDADGGFKGIVDIFGDHGIEFANEMPGYENFTDFLTDQIRVLPPRIKSVVEELYEETLKHAPAFADKSLDEATDELASMASQAGRILNSFSQIVSALKLRSGTSLFKINNLTEEVLDVVPKSMRDKIQDATEEGTAKLQQNLIRMLITHPGTTALNVVGWTHASALQSTSDIIRGTLYGGRAAVEGLIGRGTSAAKYAKMSKLMLSLQRQKIANLVDPFSTKQAALDFLSANPHTQKELFRYISGGIELDDVYKELGIHIGDEVKEGAIEKAMSFMQTVYGVKAQDIFTKTQEFMYSIDKQMRLRYGKTYSEVLTDGDLWRKMRSDEWLELQTVAVDDALRNVYAKSYGKDPKGLLTYTAKILEDMRNHLGIGAMVPFGQFFNNTLGHMFDYSGISYAHKYVARTNRDPIDLITKAAAGWTLVGVTAAREIDNLKEGLAWYEERHSDGSIRDRRYDFPYSYYKAMGRFYAHVSRDDSIPKDLVKDIVRTFGPENLTRQLGDSSKMLYDLMIDLTSGEEEDAIQALKDIVVSTVSMYTSGYSRPLDPVNQVVGLMRGEKYAAVDRKQGKQWVNKSMRYVDQIFSALSGENIAPEKFSAITDVRTPSPIGNIFGYRERAGQTHIQQMFNEVGKPQWRTEIVSSIPEVQNDLNRLIFHFLDSGAEKVVESPAWRSASHEIRRGMLSGVTRIAKEKLVAVLKASTDPNDTALLTLYDLSKKGGKVSRSELTSALKDLNLGKEVSDLSQEQLNFLVHYIELRKEEAGAAVDQAL
jgi:hypothetical protein